MTDDYPPITDIMTSAEYAALMAEEKAKKRRNKYGAVPVRDPEDGYFPSTGEHARWKQLKLLQAVGEIRGLLRQVPFALWVGQVHVCDYVCDFLYLERQGDEWRPVVEDFKGGPTRTPVYRLKAKLMLACHNIEIRETGRG